MKIVDYMLAELENDLQMQELLSSGWQPQGGVAIANGAFYQAMVKYEEEKKLADLPVIGRQSPRPEPNLRGHEK